MSRKRFLVIAAGGTGGHMFPAEALAREMLRRGWRVALSSDARGLRYANGFPSEVARRETRAASLARGGLRAKLGAPVKLAGGALATLWWFLRDRPDCVAGFGGYPAAPALAAATLLRAPRLIHEQNAVFGRVNALFAARVGLAACGSWPLRDPPKGARLAHVGNPVRDAVRERAGTPYAPPAPTEALRLLAFGGSQGASVFATLLPAAVALLDADLRARLSIVQQARPGEAGETRAAYARLGVEAEIAPFFDDMPRRMAKAHLVIARAGASSIAEIAALGRPSILIPFPAALDDHQTANAAPLAEAGGALVEAEARLTPEALARHLSILLRDPTRLAVMAHAAESLARLDAAAILADHVEALAEGRNPV